MSNYDSVSPMSTEEFRKRPSEQSGVEDPLAMYMQEFDTPRPASGSDTIKPVGYDTSSSGSDDSNRNINSDVVAPDGGLWTYSRETPTTADEAPKRKRRNIRAIAFGVSVVVIILIVVIAVACSRKNNNQESSDSQQQSSTSGSSGGGSSGGATSPGSSGGATSQGSSGGDTASPGSSSSGAGTSPQGSPGFTVTVNQTLPCYSEVNDGFFDYLSDQLSANFNSNIFLSLPPDETSAPLPSKVYKFEDFMTALKNLQNAGDQFKLWLGDDCSLESKTIAMVNMATFLGQAMRETIIYDVCDENNWDSWIADVYKEPGSPEQYKPAFYPMSSGCGQLGQKYAEYDCEDACPEDSTMELTAVTHAAWIGAPPPLFCGPKTTYNGLGYWNPQMLCRGAGDSCVGQPFYYEGQTAGVHISVAEDGRFPEYFYTHPLPDAAGNTPAARTSDQFPATNVEGCCWWGRGVIQTTGRCNFGKLNKYLGAGAGDSALYPQINFCKDPEAICSGPSDLKWVAGIFYWVSEVQIYDKYEWNYKEGVQKFVTMGCADNPDMDGCDFLFEYASGIVNRGCHDPGQSGCPGCVVGATCGPAHNVPERVTASKLALRALMTTINGGSYEVPPQTTAGTCGNGSVGNGICPNPTLCCSQWGSCGSSAEYCAGQAAATAATPAPVTAPATSAPVASPPAADSSSSSSGSGGTCGNGVVGNGQCPNAGDCCSEWGYCGTGSAYCKRRKLRSGLS